MANLKKNKRPEELGSETYVKREEPRRKFDDGELPKKDEKRTKRKPKRRE